MTPLDWPLATVPRIHVAGRFPLADRAFGTSYRSVTHALHLHHYAGRMRLAGGEIELADGDVTLSPAGLVSAYDLTAGGHHWCVHFTVADAAADSCALLLHRALGAAALAFRERLAHVAALHARGDPLAAAQAGLALQQALLWLADSAGQASPSAAEQAAAIIDARFDEPLTPAAIARAVDRSPAHLARAFRARFGTTMPHRLLLRRAEHARYLLESTDLPVWRVAERVGIPDAQHFNKTLRRLLGASPRAIRAGGMGAKVDPDR
ncbi:helix-turn-helix transcriptional regulator [Sphingomonas jatrophae]|uniref:AraC-type DNA-binding protein n=1 Tax=Sphingomonas jatrophae TaxID=1166337 RepID=A0A1I6K850_9SPHN|nr:AraC family transcriptional regulator [Sphingomonas jatrophae]SFR87386.1 AraC-type DNA-binding protein [Sphingomonas jatrophae]